MTGTPVGPSWLELAATRLDVGGCFIAYRRFGEQGAPPVVLVHGGGAHAGWWLDVAPGLARTHDVVAVDLSGHGDSGHRSTYGATTWARELAAVIESLRVGAAHVIGHSMGGLVALHLADEAPQVVRSLVLVDSVVRRRSPPVARRERQVRTYPTREELLARFRLQPAGTVAPAERIARVAAGAVREVPGGWRWKADPRAVHYLDRHHLAAATSNVRCPIGYVMGGRSELVDVGSVLELRERTGQAVPMIEIAEAYHHVPLDAPEKTLAAIETLLGPRDHALSDLAVM